jgi:hypothetical protein
VKVKVKRILDDMPLYWRSHYKGETRSIKQAHVYGLSLASDIQHLEDGAALGKKRDKKYKLVLVP